MQNFIPDDPNLIAANDLKQQCEEKLTACMEILRYEQQGHVRPQIVYDLKGHTAGQALYKENVIRMNSLLLVRNTVEMVHTTLPHEFAHIAAYRFYGREGTGHGYMWQRTMWELGLTPTRCHNMDTVPARTHTPRPKFKYRCYCNKGYVELGQTRHKRMQANKTRYICGRCNKTLTAADYMGNSALDFYTGQ